MHKQDSTSGRVQLSLRFSLVTLNIFFYFPPSVTLLTVADVFVVIIHEKGAE